MTNWTAANLYEQYTELDRRLSDKDKAKYIAGLLVRHRKIVRRLGGLFDKPRAYMEHEIEEISSLIGEFKYIEAILQEKYND